MLIVADFDKVDVHFFSLELTTLAVSFELAALPILQLWSNDYPADRALTSHTTRKLVAKLVITIIDQAYFTNHSPGVISPLCMLSSRPRRNQAEFVDSRRWLSCSPSHLHLQAPSVILIFIASQSRCYTPASMVYLLRYRLR